MHDGMRTEAEFDTFLGTLGMDAVLRGASASASLRPTLVSGPPGVSWPPDAADAGGDAIELDRVIGEGAMGVVHLGVQTSMRRPVAVKVVRRGETARSLARELRREAWVTGALEHPNIVPVYALGRDDDGGPMLVMKHVVGRPWSEVIAADRIAGTLAANLKQHLDVLIDVCKAVHFANARGVIHRDLKPENVMLGDFGLVYVVDWGIAVGVRDDADPVFPRPSAMPELVGTPSYMAPEMVDPAFAPLSERTDVYLLGGMLHELLAGERPHQAPTMNATLLRAYASVPARYGAGVPTELATRAKRAMARDPSQRPADAESFRQALVDFLRHRTSMTLAEQAGVQAIGLERAVYAVAPGREPDLVEVQKLGAAARFGFEQALASWPGNPVARAGLQQTIELLLEFALRERDHTHAQRLLADMPEPRPALARRVEQLGHELAVEKARVEALEDFRRDMDPDHSRTLRRTLVTVLALVWTAVPFAAGWLVRAGIMQPSFGVYFAAWVGFVALVGSNVWVEREKLMANRASRQVVLSLGSMLGTTLVVRAIPVLRGESMLASAPYELAAYGLTAFLLGSWLEPIVMVAGLAYSIGAMSAAVWPAWTFECIGVANGLALGTVTVVMWRAPASKGSGRDASRPR